MEIEMTIDRQDIHSCLQSASLADNAYDEAISLLLQYHKEGNSIVDAVLEEFYSSDTSPQQRLKILTLINELLKVTQQNFLIFVQPLSFKIADLARFIT